MIGEIQFVYAFIDPITIGVGLAVGGAGLFSSNKAAKKQRRAQKAYERQANKIYEQQAGISSQISDVSVRNEQIREQQALLDFRRTRREAIRRSQLARATSITRGATQGALNTTGVQGGIAQINQELTRNLSDLEQNFDLGTEVFANNRETLRLQNQSAQLGTNLNRLNTSFQSTSARNQNNINLGNSISNLGLSIAGNAGQINKVGSTLFKLGG